MCAYILQVTGGADEQFIVYYTIHPKNIKFSWKKIGIPNKMFTYQLHSQKHLLLVEHYPLQKNKPDNCPPYPPN